MEIYILRLDMYHEWAWENGSCDLIGVYTDIDKLLNKLEGLLTEEENQEHILDLDVNIETYIKFLHDRLSCSNFDKEYINIYDTQNDYDNGCDNGSYVIEKRLLNDSEVI